MGTITQIRTELHARKGDWPVLCKATGLSYWWLTKFAQGHIREPGLSKIERLQAYFIAHPRDDDDPVPVPARRTGAAPEGGDAAQADGVSVQPVSEAA